MTQPPVIACIDDDEYVREALAGLLSSAGFATEVFSSAELFLESPHIDAFACVITDVRLGGMSGLELLRRLKAAGHRMPTMVVTAYDSATLRAEAAAVGALCLHRKPIDTQELLQSLEDMQRLPPE